MTPENNNLNNNKNMKNIQEHFDNEAQIYDQLILSLIPNYEMIVDTLISSIPFDELKPIKILDLGCGTGNISKKIKNRFPNAKITCVDLAENMIKIARDKLSNYSDILFVLNDFQNMSGNGDYDVIISALALHHLETDNDKKKIYNKIFTALVDGGVFYNADVVLGSTDYLQDMYIKKWKKFLLNNYSEKEIETKWMPIHLKEDKPAKTIDHIKWLEKSGFKQIDVVWKCYNYMVYGGVK